MTQPDQKSDAYLLGIAEQALCEIVVNKANKNWRKPECVFAAVYALNMIATLTQDERGALLPKDGTR